MPSPSKTKGSAFERTLASHLTTVFGEQFMRVPSSGAYTGKSNSYRLDGMTDLQKRVFRGDIIPGPSLQNVKFECKSYKTISWPKIIQGSCTQLDGWITQAEDDLLLWFLVFKINGNGTYVLYDNSWGKMIPPGSYVAYRHYILHEIGDFFTVNKGSILQISDDITRAVCPSVTS